MRTTSIGWTTAGTLVAVALAVAQVDAGQTRAFGAAQASAPDARWMPWLGCWQLVRDSQDDQARVEADLVDSARDPAPAGNVGSARSVEDLTVCVMPSGPNGVTMKTQSRGTTLFEDTIVADGARHPVTEPDCGGWQSAEWAIGGDRLLAQAEVSCGAQPVRRVSGVTAMAAGATWLDIQVADIEGYESVRVRRYRRARDQAPAGLSAELLERAERATMMAAGRPLTLQNVIDASGRVSPRAIEVALVEIGAGFVVDRDSLIVAAEAGVDQNVLDLMVALSYPDRFGVERWTGAPAVSASEAPRIVSYGYDPYYYRPYGFGPYYHYYYEPFGYAGWGYYYGYPYYGYRPGYWRPGGPFYRPGRPGTRGRAVNNRGYTRVQPRGSGGGVSPDGSRSGGGRSSGGSSGGSSSGSSGGGSVSPSGASSGGGGAGGRTAVPR